MRVYGMAYPTLHPTPPQPAGILLRLQSSSASNVSKIYNLNWRGLAWDWEPILCFDIAMSDRQCRGWRDPCCHESQLVQVASRRSVRTESSSLTTRVARYLRFGMLFYVLFI